MYANLLPLPVGDSANDSSKERNLRTTLNRKLFSEWMGAVLVLSFSVLSIFGIGVRCMQNLSERELISFVPPTPNSIYQNTVTIVGVCC